MSDLTAKVFGDANRWVVDCPAGCGNAWQVEPGQTGFQCYLAPVRLPGGGMTQSIGCRAVFALEWPADTSDVMAGEARTQLEQKKAQAAYEAEAAREAEAQRAPDGTETKEPADAK